MSDRTKRIVVAIGMLLALCGCEPYTLISRYATLEDARDDRLFERGWLPEVLPASTTGIRTENDLDLNISEGEFSFGPADARLLFRNLSRGAPATARLAGWQETVSAYGRRGYSAWSFRDENSTWAFFCKAQLGHCEYPMWLR